MAAEEEDEEEEEEEEEDALRNDRQSDRGRNRYLMKVDVLPEGGGADH